MQLKNVSAEPVEVNSRMAVDRETAPHREVFFVVTFQNGERRRFKPIVERGESTSFRLLHPGEFVEAEYQVNNAFEMSAPGGAVDWSPTSCRCG